MNGAFVILAFCCFAFALFCLLRFMDCARESREQAEAIERWWAERAKQRAEQDSSSLMDDSPATEDRGPRAA